MEIEGRTRLVSRSTIVNVTCAPSMLSVPVLVDEDDSVSLWK